MDEAIRIENPEVHWEYIFSSYEGCLECEAQCYNSVDANGKKVVVLHGVCITHDTDDPSKIMHRLNYEHGHLHGAQEEYIGGTGTIGIASAGIMVYGTRVGVFTTTIYTTENHVCIKNPIKLIRTGTFNSDGKLHGITTETTRSGELLAIAEYVDDRNISSWKLNEHGVLIEALRMVGDKIQGTVWENEKIHYEYEGVYRPQHAGSQYLLGNGADCDSMIYKTSFKSYASDDANNGEYFLLLHYEADDIGNFVSCKEFFPNGDVRTHHTNEGMAAVPKVHKIPCQTHWNTFSTPKNSTATPTHDLREGVYHNLDVPIIDIGSYLSNNDYVSKGYLRKEYFPNGKLKSLYTFKRGGYDGEFILFNESSEILLHKYFVNCCDVAPAILEDYDVTSMYDLSEEDNVSVYLQYDNFFLNKL